MFTNTPISIAVITIMLISLIACINYVTVIKRGYEDSLKREQEITEAIDKYLTRMKELGVPEDTAKETMHKNIDVIVSSIE